MPPGRRGRGKVVPLLIILGPDGEINAPEPKAVLSWSGGQDARNTRKKQSVPGSTEIDAAGGDLGFQEGGSKVTL
jgi:hypothetical protein